MSPPSEDKGMGLHVVVMAITVGASASGTPGQAPRPALVVAACTHGAAVDLSTGVIRCLGQVAPSATALRPTLAVPKPAVPTSPVPIVRPAGAPVPVRSPRPAVAPPLPPAAPAVSLHPVHRAAPIGDNGVRRASAPAPQTLADSFLHPQPSFYDLMAEPAPPLPPATGGDSHDDGPSVPGQFVHGLGEGLRACAKGGAVGAVGGAVGAAAATVVSGGVAAPSIPVASGFGAVGGCATGIATRLVSAF